MSDRPIFDALNKPLEIPEEQPDSFAIQGEHSKAGTDISAQVTTDFAGPGGWAAGGQGGWSSSLGAYVKGWVSFFGKQRREAMGDDPRTDRHPETGAPGKYPTPEGEPKPAPGGAGTGTPDAPEKDPDAQPGKKQ